MDISFRLEFLFIFLSLSLLTGRELTAQSSHEMRCREISEKFENIAAPVLSGDGVWLTLRKGSYSGELGAIDQENDTVLIFDLRDKEAKKQPVLRSGVISISFLGDTHLILATTQHIELLNLVDNTSIYYKNALQFMALDGGRLFILHYNKEGGRRLELRDNTGILLTALDHVSRFYVTKDSCIYAITDNGKDRYEVYSIKDGLLKKIYRSNQKILSLEADTGGQGIVINKNSPESGSIEVVYLDLKEGKCFYLKDAFNISVENCFSEVIREGELYFLRLWVRGECEDTSLVDIWYGNDNKLEEKFYTPTREVCYVWEPLRNIVQRVGSECFINNVFTGDDCYFLSFDPYSMQDYTGESLYKVNAYNRLDRSYTLLDTLSNEWFVAPEGRNVLYAKRGSWYLHNISSGCVKSFGSERMKTPHFTPDGKRILFSGEGGLWIYNIEDDRLSRLEVFEGTCTSILNTKTLYLQGAMGASVNVFDPSKPIVLELTDLKRCIHSYLLWKNGELDTIVPPTHRHIKYLKHDEEYHHFVYSEEDYNLPPRIVFKAIGENEKVIYQSNKNDYDILSLKQEMISYVNSDGVQLKGVLYYPMHYTSFQKYPLVVHIYSIQNESSNRYLFPSYYNDLGFNIRLLLEKGYFVYLPDILTREGRGPGMEALDCVDRSLDALALNPLIDKFRIGLIGHSFGGYETDFIATHSRRFAAYVSGSGHSDILWTYHSFNYNFFWPDFKRLESGQYAMGIPFVDDKALYFENNPIYSADRVSAPVLLWSGLKDKNVTSDQSMALYNALRRNGKDVIALFYKDEGHDMQTPSSQYDLTCRILDWFDYNLKGETGIDWINRGLKH